MARKEETVLGEIWSLHVVEGGALGMVHGCYREIKEIYIPSLKTTINVVDNCFNCFDSDGTRYSKPSYAPARKLPAPKRVAKIQVPKKIADSVAKYLEAQPILTEWCKKLIPEN